MKFGYQGNWWKDDREEYTQRPEPGVHLHGGIGGYAFIPALDHRVREPVLQQRARGDDVVLRAGSVDAEAPHAAGRACATTIPGAGSRPSISRRAVSSPACTSTRADGVTGYNDITPRMGAAYDVFGNGKTALKVNLGKYLQGASVGNLLPQREPVAPHSGRRRRGVRQPVGDPHVDRRQRQLRSRTAT